MSFKRTLVKTGGGHRHRETSTYATTCGRFEVSWHASGGGRSGWILRDPHEEKRSVVCATLEEVSEALAEFAQRERRP